MLSVNRFRENWQVHVVLVAYILERQKLRCVLAGKSTMGVITTCLLCYQRQTELLGGRLALGTVMSTLLSVRYLPTLGSIIKE